LIDAKVKKRVVAEVDKLKEDLLKILQKTVQIRSVNPTYPGVEYEKELGGETKVNESAEPIMREMGFKTEFVEAVKGRKNLVGV
jgi:acetylornithine deacetylase/succinyl-diaminopimelate desuccinylase-like protein